jgi:N-acetyl-alpha-D-glucosaminyl L-malate synthase BshA
VIVPDYPVFETRPYTMAVANAIAELAATRPIDVVHLHYAVPHAAAAVLARCALGDASPAFVLTLHGTDVTRVGADPLLARVARAATLAMDGRSVPSAFLQAEALRWLDKADAPDTVAVLANFVDEQRFTVAEDGTRGALDHLFPNRARPASGPDPSPLLVHVSNFRPIKRVGDALEVLATLRKVRDVRLCLVGEGPDRARLEAQCRVLGLRDCVHFAGRTVDVAHYVRHADGFLLTSESESFGLAALEALSCGVPVFGYKVGGLPEVVTGDVGRLVPAFDRDALASALIDVLGDTHELARLRKNARQRVLDSFRKEPALERYEQWYRRSKR